MKYITKLILLICTTLFFSCMLDKPIDVVYIQPDTLKTLQSEIFTIGTGSQYYKLSAFAIGKYEVTFDQWRKTYDWAVQNGYNFIERGNCGSTKIKTGSYTEEQGQLPVCRISWGDAIVWCNALSEKEGLEPVYLFSDGSVVRDSEIQNDDYIFQFSYTINNHTKNGYRLPTKIEWQFAAQGGVDGRSIYSGTDTEETLTEYAWIYSNAESVIQKVGTKKANSLGLYDMSGNVDEWIWDWITGTNDDTTTKISVNGVVKNVYINPDGPAWTGQSSTAKYVMGGNVNCGNPSSSDLGERNTDSCKISYTSRACVPALYETYGGFRICRTTGEQ